MKILPHWLREFVEISADDRQLAADLTAAGIAVEGITSVETQHAASPAAAPENAFEVEITPNRVDAMNHYGIARECAAIYDRDLKPLPVWDRPPSAGQGERSSPAVMS